MNHCGTLLNAPEMKRPLAAHDVDKETHSHDTGLGNTLIKFNNYYKV